MLSPIRRNTKDSMAILHNFARFRKTSTAEDFVAVLQCRGLKVDGCWLVKLRDCVVSHAHALTFFFQWVVCSITRYHKSRCFKIQKQHPIIFMMRWLIFPASHPHGYRYRYNCMFDPHEKYLLVRESNWVDGSQLFPAAHLGLSSKICGNLKLYDDA